MSQEIEIEFKNLLTKEEFLKLKDFFDINENNFFYQENHYFDTPEFSLKELGSALRIRKKQDSYCLTLKEPAEIGILETHQIIPEKVANQLINSGQLVEGQISERLIDLGVDYNSIIYFGTLSTTRAEKEYQNGLLVLDHSQYLSTEDYELEYEVQDEAIGKVVFKNLLDELNIPIRHTKNKIRRFYEQKYKEMG
ncbi:CYTH domain-containing protein [Metabacillus litoralis]|uniref:CYTH domain-containing protein n=1 Tax=Metabacillus litoralis TaxID=152268 RepID=UPI001CFF4D78|nr:CYTH domain-containing protein [Metabacillus litoralis]